ncbi:hypothetical protein B0H67DRAFT_567237 [Lasiosphaeris hirsuta]|uniref:Uncharacterized protein n=1 Tax=Lasiosphaeris hirsuta TaxID=260670 RepID=A0AA40E6C2_9PEZI|nr:hypothetical protein B0H67DRAFT_567237 [Lasiosphaeris hirsuta]
MRRLEPARCLLLSIELVIVATALGVFAHGYTQDLRRVLWVVGGERGWNSNPRLRIYFYANHRQPPPIPFLWTDRLADSLLGIAIVSVVVWVIKIGLLCFDLSLPLFSAFYDMLLSGFWMFCVNAQSSSDLTDPQHLSPSPWYLERSCGQLSGHDGIACKYGKTSFTIAVVCMGFYLGQSIVSVLRLAYWCGKYRVLDRCAIWLGQYCLGSEGKRQGSRFARDMDMELLEQESLCEHGIHEDSE